MTPGGGWLAVGGSLSLLAAALHLGCIIGGPRWYRFAGAGEGMARAAERAEVIPALITAGITAVLMLWAAYAFAGAGLIAPLPLLRIGLITITLMYLARGLVVLMPWTLGRPDLSPAFLLWSSLIVFGYGAVHAIGTWRVWNSL